MFLKLANGLSDLLKANTGKSSVTINGCSEGQFHAQVKMTANGWGPAANLAMNIASAGQRQQVVQMLGMMQGQ